MELKDKIALVTGSAGQGMGRSIALTLARKGAKVAVNYRTSKDQAQAIVSHIENHSGHAMAVEADVFQAEDCKNLVDKLDSSAAMEDVQHELAPFFHLMPLVLPPMYERRWGRVIGIALLPPYDSPAYSYNVGKAARVHTMLKARDEMWRHGVTVNIMAPGPVPAIESLAEAIEQCEHGPAWQKRANTSPQDIAESVAFLCSDAGRFITGCILPFLFHS